MANKTIELFKEDLSKSAKDKKFDDVTFYDFSMTSVSITEIESANLVTYTDGSLTKTLKNYCYQPIHLDGR